MMEDYTYELEERVVLKNQRDSTLDDIALDIELVNKPSSIGLNNFTNRRMAVMMMCVDSATAESENYRSIAEMVRKAARSVRGEVIVMEETWNSIIVTVGPNLPQSTAGPVAQLIIVAGQVINEVLGTPLSIKYRVLIHNVHDIILC